MKNLDRMVLVVARESVNLVKLASSENLLRAPCGNMGRIIAKRVLDDGGSALIRAGDIKIAIDTHDGLHALLDNFDLFDARTQKPLLHLLLENS